MATLLSRSSSTASYDIQNTDVTPVYYPGVYSSALKIKDSAINLEIVCDSTQIKSVRIVNLDESIETMYPLLGPALEDIEMQLCLGTDVDKLTLSESSQYTQTFLINGIKKLLEKAKIK